MLLPLDRLNTKFNIINQKYGEFITKKIKNTIKLNSLVCDIITIKWMYGYINILFFMAQKLLDVIRMNFAYVVINHMSLSLMIIC